MKMREMPMKKVSRVFEQSAEEQSAQVYLHKNNRNGNRFTVGSDVDNRACFNRSTWISAVNMQQSPPGTSDLTLGHKMTRVLQNLRTSWITTLMALGGATVAQ